MSEDLSKVKGIIDQLNENSQTDPFSLSGVFKALSIDAWADPISRTFIILILALALWAFFRPDNKFIKNNSVSILPSLGILGTFIGVLVAVSKFDPNQIWASLETIIQGLKIAFSTSIWGLAASIAVRARLSHAHKEATDYYVGPEQLLEAINKGNEQAKKQGGELIGAISGEADGSLNTQLRLIRQDFNDFAKTVAEANTSAFMDALEKAIADFNQNLTEQFGENFAQLNVAVGKLLEWQENNKKDMDQMRKTLDEAVQAVQRTRESLEAIEKASASIPNNMDRLTELLEVHRQQITDLEVRIKTFSEISEKASDALPRIEDVLKKHTDGLEASINSILGSITKQVESQGDGLEQLEGAYHELSNSVSNLGDQIKADIGEVTRSVAEATQQAIDGITETSNVINQNISNTTESSLKTAEEILNDHKKITEIFSKALQEEVSGIGNSLNSVLTQAVNDFVKNFDNSLSESKEKQQSTLDQFKTSIEGSYARQTENLQQISQEHLQKLSDNVNKIIESELDQMAQRLGGIAGRLAEDYGPLSDQFRKIVELANEAQRQD